MNTNQQYNVSESQSPTEPTEQPTQGTVKKPKQGPSPSQQGKFQAAIDETKTKQGSPEDVDIFEAAADESAASLFGLAGSTLKKPTKDKPASVRTSTQASAQAPTQAPVPTQVPLQQAVEEVEGEPEIAPISLSEKKMPKEPSKEAVMEMGFQAAMQKVSSQPIEQPVIQPKTPEVSHQVSLQQLVDQIASHITTMTTKHVEEITIDIKFPPLFAGAQVTVKEYQQAKGEFNISFNNLTVEARQLIESNVQQKKLQDALVEKGYKIHIISVEAPKIQAPIFTDTERTESQRQGGQDWGGQQESDFTGQGRRPK